MIIDLILDRKDNEEAIKKYGTYIFCDCGGNEIDIRYNPRKFYFDVLRYLNGCGSYYADIITAAMDYGEETDVKQALCRYVIECEYNPDICNYINGRKWLIKD